MYNIKCHLSTIIVWLNVLLKSKTDKLRKTTVVFTTKVKELSTPVTWLPVNGFASVLSGQLGTQLLYHQGLVVVLQLKQK